MADWSKIIKHIISFEGDHSADPDDNALKLGHSGVKGNAINPATSKAYDPKHPNNFIHTNKGIIWATYKTYKTAVNLPPSAAEFLRMDKALWLDIYKKLFWDEIKGDQIKSQAIAEAILEAKWGGGGKTLIQQLQAYLNNLGAGLRITGTINTPTLNAINSYSKTKQQQTDIITYLYDKRMSYLRSLSDWKKYGRGWSRRMSANLKRAMEYIKSTPLISGALIIAPLLFFFVYKYLKK